MLLWSRLFHIWWRHISDRSVGTIAPAWCPHNYNDIAADALHAMVALRRLSNQQYNIICYFSGATCMGMGIWPGDTIMQPKKVTPCHLMCSCCALQERCLCVIAVMVAVGSPTPQSTQACSARQTPPAQLTASATRSSTPCMSVA